MKFKSSDNMTAEGGGTAGIVQALRTTRHRLKTNARALGPIAINPVTLRIMGPMREPAFRNKAGERERENLIKVPEQVTLAQGKNLTAH